MGQPLPTSAALAADLTWRSSRQAFWTIRWLVDRDRVADAFRAYGYFRWVDDQLDLDLSDRQHRVDFLRRQQTIAAACYAGRPPLASLPEERMVIDLIQNNPSPVGGLASYVEHMFRVMQFDCDRRGRHIRAAELESYTHSLAVAVTEALIWFIGHDQPEVPGHARYLSAAGAHIVHMLRDAHDDVEAGYFNVPEEVLTRAGMGPEDFQHPAYCAWVRERVELAHGYFQAGRSYLSQLGSLRCRLAGSAYQERFLWLLESMEHHAFVLQPAYPLPGWMARVRQGLSPLFYATSRGRQALAEPSA